MALNRVTKYCLTKQLLRISSVSYKCSEIANNHRKMTTDPKQYLKQAAETANKWCMSNGVSHGSVESESVTLPKRVTIIGGGTMGTGIAASLALSGYYVHVVEMDRQAQEKCKASLQRLSEKYAVKLGMQGKVHFTVNGQLEEAKDSQLIIEAIIENMNKKKKLFKKLDKICSPETVFASNTSTLDIDEIAESTSRISQVVGMHFFTPAHINKLVEVIYGKYTNADTVQLMFNLTNSINKMPVLVKNVWGFAANRILLAYITAVMNVVQLGALTPTAIDKAMIEFGFGLGPFAVMDMSGLDVLWNINKEAKIPNNPIHDVMVRNGNLGVKTGKGFHIWENGRPLPNPAAEKLIREHSNGVHVNFPDNQTIQKHCLYPVVNKAFEVLEQEIVAHESDIDLIYSHGFGWPKSKIGPMFWARNIEGLDNIVKGLQKMRAIGGNESVPKTNATLIKQSNSGAKL